MTSESDNYPSTPQQDRFHHVDNGTASLLICLLVVALSTTLGGSFPLSFAGYALSAIGSLSWIPFLVCAVYEYWKRRPAGWVPSRRRSAITGLLGGATVSTVVTCVVKWRIVGLDGPDNRAYHLVYSLSAVFALFFWTAYTRVARSYFSATQTRQDGNEMPFYTVIQILLALSGSYVSLVGRCPQDDAFVVLWILSIVVSAAFYGMYMGKRLMERAQFHRGLITVSLFLAAIGVYILLSRSSGMFNETVKRFGHAPLIILLTALGTEIALLLTASVLIYRFRDPP